MGIKGKSYKSLAFKLGVSVKTLYDWEKKFPKWKMAKEMAENGRLGFLEDLLIDLGNGTNKGNAASAIFYAKNANPDEFKDKREVEHTGGVTYVIDTGIPAKQIRSVENENLDSQPIIEVDYFEVDEGQGDEDGDLL